MGTFPSLGHFAGPLFLGGHCLDGRNGRFQRLLHHSLITAGIFDGFSGSLTGAFQL